MAKVNAALGQHITTAPTQPWPFRAETLVSFNPIIQSIFAKGAPFLTLLSAIPSRSAKTTQPSAHRCRGLPQGRSGIRNCHGKKP